MAGVYRAHILSPFTQTILIMYMKTPTEKVPKVPFLQILDFYKQCLNIFSQSKNSQLHLSNFKVIDGSKETFDEGLNISGRGRMGAAALI